MPEDSVIGRTLRMYGLESFELELSEEERRDECDCDLFILSYQGCVCGGMW